MRKRTAAFIGSAEWRKRDVRVQQQNARGGMRMTDKPSRISITYYAYVNPEQHYGELAHRVVQLTT